MHSIGVEEARSYPRTRSATAQAVESVKSGSTCATEATAQEGEEPGAG